MKAFTGGPLDTNAFLLESPRGDVLFDAPQGADDHFAGRKIALLVLTHGHFDHVADAAAIAARHGCQVWMHELTVPMVTRRDFFHDWGFALEVEPVPVGRLVGEGSLDLLGTAAETFHVPGHCPGSLCIYLPGEKALIGGDVLFAGGVGRWDLPMGDFAALESGIRSKLYRLPPETRVLPGHGPATMIGEEMRTNPFVPAV